MDCHIVDLSFPQRNEYGITTRMVYQRIVLIDYSEDKNAQKVTTKICPERAVQLLEREFGERKFLIEEFAND